MISSFLFFQAYVVSIHHTYLWKLLSMYLFSAVSVHGSDYIWLKIVIRNTLWNKILLHKSIRDTSESYFSVALKFHTEGLLRVFF